MNVLRRGKRLSLSASAVIGVGGEATVFDLGGGEVAKVWHTPDASHGRKLRELSGVRLPAELVAPSDCLTDRSGEIVGFVMPRLDAAFVPFAGLCKKSSPASSLTVVKILRRLRAVLVALHADGIVVGDLSDQNVVVRGEDVRLLDVDSVQIAGEPCPVATEGTLDPALYGVDLQSAPAFSPRTDAYAFAVLAFRSLLHVHPYGGTHPHLVTLPERARDRVSVFDAGVTYPQKVSRPLASLPAALLDVFEGMFCRGERGLVADALFADLERDLCPCSSCGLPFSRSRGTCPGCATTLPRPRASRSVTAQVFVEAAGEIVAGAVTFVGITVVSRTDGAWVRHEQRGGGVVESVLGATDGGHDGHVIVARNGDVLLANETGEVRVFGAGETEPRLTTTERFGAVPVIAVRGESPVRLCGGVALVASRFHDTYLERTVATILPAQTWLDPGPHPDGVVLGFFRVFRAHRFFRVDDKRFLELAPTSLAVDEIVEDVALLDDHGRTLCARHTRDAGVPLARLDLLDERGAVMAQSVMRRDASPTRERLGGRLVSGGVVLHPTDDGIVREELRHGGLGICTVLGDTEPFVSARSVLLTHPRGVVVLSGSRATLLER